MAAQEHSQGAFARAVNSVEETAIAAILAAMTIITFTNVVLRYGFNTGIIWGLEATSYLFAWLVLVGVGYAVKVTAHLGVDAVTGSVPRPVRKTLGLLAAAVCLAYAFLLLKGAWDYWANFANLPRTTGRWLPTGFEEMTPTSYRAWYAAEDVPMPGFLSFVADVMGNVDEYENLPRFLPYVILPVGALVLLLRFVQATMRLLRGEADTLIVSHEAEDAQEETPG